MFPTRKQKLKKVKLQSQPAHTSFSWVINYPSVLVCVENTSVAKENERDGQAEGRHVIGEEADGVLPATCLSSPAGVNVI